MLILEMNFKTVESIFGMFVPICAMNLRKMYCEYTCGANKNQYVNGTGYVEKMHNNQLINMTKVQWSIDEDVACTVFKSCKSTPLISLASIQSSIQFFDFLVSKLHLLIKLMLIFLGRQWPKHILFNYHPAIRATVKFKCVSLIKFKVIKKMPK